MVASNKFCSAHSLSNEADVEQALVRRLIESLGYSDKQIRPKDSLSELTVRLYRGSESQYRPDFAVKVGRQIRWIVEAKSPNEALDKHEPQPRAYCSLLNGQYLSKNPVEFFVLTNGHFTRLYKWDVTAPLLELDFADLVDGNAKFRLLSRQLSPKKFKHSGDAQPSRIHALQKFGLGDVNAAFAWCHQHIYKKDAMSQAAAFQEFVKIVFLKLLFDREIREKYPSVAAENIIEIPEDEAWFSMGWIKKHESERVPSPLNTIQFVGLLSEMEKDIALGKKKRIFNAGEQITLSAETVKGVVAKLEDIFLFGIDADLNGRLFETFLNATMRGKDLGQFFTPRSVVKLGARLACLRVNTGLSDGSRHTDKVLDACCGTGGFLIEALADMWRKVDDNAALGSTQKVGLKDQIAREHIYGIDLGREPPLARIARINMYLHGDGGSCIFQADALDKDVAHLDNNPELVAERDELRTLIGNGDVFDVILTNPPFAKTYDRKTKHESSVLDKYEIGFDSRSSKMTRRASLKSSLMFMERYVDLLKPGGRIVTVIDDGILSGKDYRWFRDYLRREFLIKGIISLPGDAFQRSKARVKTSLLVAEKRTSVGKRGSKEDQGSVFMYPCRFVGIDDPARQRILPVDRENRAKAAEEIENATKHFRLFLEGNGDPDYLVAATMVSDRMDVKSCLETTGRKVPDWLAGGFSVVPLSELVDPVEFDESNPDRIVTDHCHDFVTHLRVRYDGFAETGDEIVASDSTYSHLHRVHSGDIAISGMAAFYGSSAIVPPELDGCVATNEYLILRAKKGIPSRLVWLLLRSTEIRADILLSGTGLARTRVRWDDLEDIRVPWPRKAMRDRLVAAIFEAEEAEQDAIRKRESATVELEDAFDLDNERANVILEAFKPPK